MSRAIWGQRPTQPAHLRHLVESWTSFFMMCNIKKRCCAVSTSVFADNQKIKAYERQLGICPICKQHFELSQMEADHITPWCEGGPTIDTNCQMLCRDCNRRKSNK